jgi:hypothetical protein
MTVKTLLRTNLKILNIRDINMHLNKEVKTIELILVTKDGENNRHLSKLR